MGDLDQAIYAFSNRYSKYLEMLLKDDNFGHYRLSKNHRCHESIVDYSLQLLGIQQKIPDDKRVIEVSVNGNEGALSKSISKNIERIKEKYAVEKNSDIAILCRGNGTAELISKTLDIKNKLFVENKLDLSHHQWSRMFADLLKDYFDKDMYAVDFTGRYIDEEIESLLFRRIHKYVDELFSTDCDELKNKISIFRKIAFAILPEYESNEAIVELKNVLQNQEELESYRPPEEDEICIMTIHKSKGLEFEIVFHMDLYDWIFPLHDISEEDFKQTLNLHYVGVTRAKQACYIMQGTKRYRVRTGDYVNAYASPFLSLNDVQNYRKKVSWDKV